MSFVDQPPTRELCVGTRYRLRVKKHDIEGGGAAECLPRAQWRMPAGPVRRLAQWLEAAGWAESIGQSLRARGLTPQDIASIAGFSEPNRNTLFRTGGLRTV